VQDWKIQRTHGQCVKTGRTFDPGESFHVVLFREDDGFRREDYSEQAWGEPPEGAYCCFKSRMPAREPEGKKRLLVDDEVLVDFFLRLGDENDPARTQFRFVLGLILMRKRLLKYEETTSVAGREVWRMRLMRDRSIHDVQNPRLDDEEIENVTRQLSTILHIEADAQTAETDPAYDSIEIP